MNWSRICAILPRFAMLGCSIPNGTMMSVAVPGCFPNTRRSWTKCLSGIVFTRWSAAMQRSNDLLSSLLRKAVDLTASHGIIENGYSCAATGQKQQLRVYCANVWRANSKGYKGQPILADHLTTWTSPSIPCLPRSLRNQLIEVNVYGFKNI